MPEASPLLLIHGEEAHLVDRDVRRWRAAAAEVEVIDAPARLEPLIASLVDMPLFGEARHVLVRDLPQLSGARRGASGVPELTRALAMRAPSTHVCFAVRGTVATGNPVLAAIAENGGRVVHHPALRPGERRQWLDAEIRARGLRLPREGADLLLRCTGGDLASMGAELDKLVAHGDATTAAQLQQLVAGVEQLELYRVLDLLAGADPAAGAALLAGLIADGRSTQYLLSILAGQLRDLLLAHAVLLRGQRTAAAVAAAMRVPAWRAERVLRTAQAIPATMAMAWLRELQRIDAGVKNGDVDDVAALNHWALAAARALSERRARAAA
jgi:DNA polymerase-3 subunit delta